MAEVEYVAAFYTEVANEIRRLREEQWRLSYYFVAEGMGVIYLFADGKVSAYLNLTVLLVAFALQIGCIVIYLVHLHRNHVYIGTARSARRKLEVFFGLHSLSLSDGESVMPAQWKGSVSRWFEYDVVVLPLMMFVLSVEGASVYVIVRGVMRFIKC